MKTLILILIALPILGISQPRRERVEAAKIGFINKELSLTEEEAIKFWPAYNQFTDKRIELMKSMRSLKASKDSVLLDNKLAQEKLKEYLKLEQDIFQNRTKFLDKVQNILPAEKVIKLISLEEKFKRMMLNRMNKYKNHKN
jgi:hypothetical protein